MRSSIKILLFALVVPMVASGQTAPDSLVVSDTVRNRFLPTGLRVGTDLIALIKTRAQDDFDGWEVNADIDFYRYFLTFDYGTWSRTYVPADGTYLNDGTYWRVGADVNFLLKDPDRNMFFLGLRYARGTFSETYDVTIIDPLWGTVTNHYSHADVPARWLELTGGLRVRVWKFLWMGYTGRFKFGLKTGDTPAMLPHDVPGYGRTHKETTWGFNYQIFLRLPFRKMPPLPPSQK